MAIFKRCNNCHKLFDGRICKECAARYSKKRQERNESLKLYGSGDWRKCRRDVRARYFDYDIWMMGIGEIRRCQKVYIHHIVEREEDPSKLFELDNLITVSFDSHEEIHKAYKVDKAEALKRIQAGIRRFHEVFG